jgi:hypothetical protein
MSFSFTRAMKRSVTPTCRRFLQLLPKAKIVVAFLNDSLSVSLPPSLPRPSHFSLSFYHPLPFYTIFLSHMENSFSPCLFNLSLSLSLTLSHSLSLSPFLFLSLFLKHKHIFILSACTLITPSHFFLKFIAPYSTAEILSPVRKNFIARKVRHFMFAFSLVFPKEKIQELMA